MKVTVVGGGFVGMTCAQRLAEQEVAEEIDEEKEEDSPEKSG